MSPRKHIPDDWRALKVGEMIIAGDYFNARTYHKEEDAYWLPAVKLIGHPYTGLTFEFIRPTSTTPKMGSNFSREDGNSIIIARDSSSRMKDTDYHIPTIPIKSTKSKVEDYLNKLKKPSA